MKLIKQDYITDVEFNFNAFRSQNVKSLREEYKDILKSNKTSQEKFKLIKGHSELYSKLIIATNIGGYYFNDMKDIHKNVAKVEAYIDSFFMRNFNLIFSMLPNVDNIIYTFVRRILFNDLFKITCNRFISDEQKSNVISRIKFKSANDWTISIPSTFFYSYDIETLNELNKKFNKGESINKYVNTTTKPSNHKSEDKPISNEDKYNQSLSDEYEKYYKSIIKGYDIVTIFKLGTKDVHNRLKNIDIDVLKGIKPLDKTSNKVEFAQRQAREYIIRYINKLKENGLGVGNDVLQQGSKFIKKSDVVKDKLKRFDTGVYGNFNSSNRGSRLGYYLIGGSPKNELVNMTKNAIIKDDEAILKSFDNLASKHIGVALNKDDK